MSRYIYVYKLIFFPFFFFFTRPFGIRRNGRRRRRRRRWRIWTFDVRPLFYPIPSPLPTITAYMGADRFLTKQCFFVLISYTVRFTHSHNIAYSIFNRRPGEWTLFTVINSQKLIIGLIDRNRDSRHPKSWSWFFWAAEEWVRTFYCATTTKARRAVNNII